MGRSLPHDIVSTILDSLISPPAHTPITPSTTSRPPSPRLCFSSACQTMHSGLPSSPPQPHSFKHRQHPRHSIFRPGTPEVDQSTAEVAASYATMDTCAI